jgi:hypothetical protein
MRARGIVFSLALILISGVAAAQSQFTGGNLVRQGPTGNLASTIAQIAAAQPVWIAYEVPASVEQEVCCGDYGQWNGDGSCGRCACRLSDDNGISTNRRSGSSIAPSLNALVTVALRKSGRGIDKIRLFSRDCAVDATGQTLYWLDGVRPADSVAFLAPLAEQEGESGGMRAMTALAMHADPAASAVLERLAAEGHSDETRGHALFWLAETRAHAGFLVASNAARTASSDRVREKAIFAVYISRDPGSTNELVDLARHDTEGGARKKALFWLAQKAGQRAEATLRDVVNNDPEESVRAHAVFAISQLPDDRSVPLLIDLAKTNRSLAVRKKALFWLGQKSDPRALEAIADMLK